MAAMDPGAMRAAIASSALTAKYAQAVDRESAHEMITARIKAATQAAQAGQAPPGGPGSQPRPPAGGRRPGGRRPAKPAKGSLDVGDIVKAGEHFATSRQGQALVRSVLGTLFGKKR
jgi:hypothetical protein